jgi:hypothetical protein
MKSQAAEKTGEKTAASWQGLATSLSEIDAGKRQLWGDEKRLRKSEEIPQLFA